MKLQMSVETAKILRERGVYESIRRDARAFEFSQRSLEDVLRRNDPNLLKGYTVVHLTHKKNYDANFFLRAKKK